MAIKKILTYPDPILRQKVETVTSFDDSLRQLAVDLAETMFAAPGAGLAANQIGVCLRVVVINISEDEEDKKPLVLVNPENRVLQSVFVADAGCCQARGRRLDRTRL